MAPVVIPTLAPTLDKPLSSDRSLCPVRELRYYMDLRSQQNKELAFVSFKKGFEKDISPAIISWIKQTVILCYEHSDQEALTLHQVKAHDVRAFAASKAFQLGVSLEQILSACHWKSHNTSTGGGHIIFAFSAVRRHTSFPFISRKSIYPIFTKFGMGVYWVNSLHGFAFGEDSCIAN